MEQIPQDILDEANREYPDEGVDMIMVDIGKRCRDAYIEGRTDERKARENDSLMFAEWILAECYMTDTNDRWRMSGEVTSLTTEQLYNSKEFQDYKTKRK